MMSFQLPLHWRQQAQRYRLQGAICGVCQQHHFPALPSCAQCASAAHLQPFTFSGKGRVYSHTTVYACPPGLVCEKPYVLAWIQLVEGPLLIAQVVDIAPETVHIGLAVVHITRLWKRQGKAGLCLYGYKFSPEIVI